MKIGLLRSILMTIVMVFSLTESIQAQTAKHPRVAELEAMLAENATRYVKSRFPEVPVLVTVRIDPLRRDTGMNNVASAENLPFLNVQQTGVVDEWDDPSKSLHDLVPRIRMATVTVILPETIKDGELVELRTALMDALNLIPARDRIDFERRAWQYGKNFDRELAIGGAAILLLLFGLTLAMRSAAGRVAKTITEAKPAAHSEASGAHPAASFTPPPSHESKSNTGGSLGQIRFDDPLKVRTQIKAVVAELLENISFPQLEDMLILDQKAQENASTLGAALAELPISTQNHLFSYSVGERWLAAFADPGPLDLSAYELLYRLAKRQRPENSEKWDELLVVAWRLGDALPDFLRTIDQETAMTILSNMPAQIAIPAGKKAFPGSWAALLEAGEKRPITTEKLINQILLRMKEIKPLNNTDMLERYRHERGLLDFLKTSSPQEERDIYQAANPNSIIYKLRPPFYVVFDQPTDRLKSIALAFPIETWSVALFNVNRERRRQFESVLTDKQKFFLIDSLKYLDQNPPSALQVGSTREEIGLYFQKLKERDKIISHKQGTDEGTVQPLVPESATDTEQSNDGDSGIHAA